MNQCSLHVRRARGARRVARGVRNNLAMSDGAPRDALVNALSPTEKERERERESEAQARYSVIAIAS